MLVGQEKPDAGTLRIGESVKIAYVDQSRDKLDDTKTAWEEISDGLDTVTVGNYTTSSRGYVGRFNFKGADQQKLVGQLSGGERNRLHLAKVLKAGGNVLLLDEPTNDLDVETLRALEQALLDFPGCAVVISHDRWFLDRVATAILAFEGDGQVTLYEGSYSFYAERRKKPGGRGERGGREAKEIRLAAATTTAAKSSGARKLSFKEARELEGIEAAIATAETRVSTLESTLSDPTVFKDRPTDVQKLITELDTARTEVERLFARWQELDALKQSGPR
jgi:ABC-type multidrug transport system ATPase subunit